MATIKSQKITVQNKAGETFTMEVALSVSDHGEFRARIPMEWAENIEFMQSLRAATVARLQDSKSPAHTKIEVLRTHTYLVCMALMPLAQVLSDGALRFIEVESTTERVICYSTSLNVRFVEYPDGRIAAFGAHGDDGYWVDESLYMRGGVYRECYSVGLWAQVYDRTTHTRGESRVTKYDWVGTDSSVDEPIRQLNGFYGMGRQLEPKGSGAPTTRHLGFAPMPYDEMPYTPEAADYFSRALLSMCELARQVQMHFGDNRRLTQAIEAGAPLRLLQPPTARSGT